MLSNFAAVNCCYDPSMCSSCSLGWSGDAIALRGSTLGRAHKSLLLADHHVGVIGIASLGARARVHVLEPFQLELILRGLHGDLLTHGIVCVDLRIRHPDAHGALRVRSLLPRKSK